MTPTKLRLTAARPHLRAVRAVLWRWRHTFGALALAAVALLVIEALDPTPPGEPAVVLTRTVPAGRALTAADLKVVRLDAQVRAASAHTEPRDLVGRSLAVGLPSGTVLVREMLAGGELVAPPGHVVLPVTLADPGSLALAQPGSHVIIVVPDEAGGVDLAEDVLVLAVMAPGASSLLSSGDGGTTVLVAVPGRWATLVMTASSSAPVRLALSG